MSGAETAMDSSVPVANGAAEKPAGEADGVVPVRGLKESNENAKPSKMVTPELKTAKPRRASESGIPTGRTTPRRASSGSGQVTTPRGRITPRETRSSVLRKSVSGVDSASLKAATTPNSPNAMGLELTRLRDDAAAKQKQADKLSEEIATLKASHSAKERALAKTTADKEGLNSRLLHAEGSLNSKTKELRDVEGERNKLKAAVQDLERQADRLNRKLHAQPKGTGFSEAIASLEAEVKGLKLDNTKLTDDAKGAHNQVRAKDKELDRMAAEVEEARRIFVQNGELENHILDLRRQLQEASSERTTLLHVQRQNKADMALLTEERDAAKAEADHTSRDLGLCRTQLKASQENATELERELALRRGELTRVTTVASRALHREASAIKEDGTVPFNQYKEEMMALKGQIARLKEKLKLEEKSAAAVQQQMLVLYGRIDALQGKGKVSPRGNGPERTTSGTPAPAPGSQEAAAPNGHSAGLPAAQHSVLKTVGVPITASAGGADALRKGHEAAAISSK